MIFLFMAANILALLLTPPVIRFCFRFKLLDTPLRRSVHTKSFPRLGGIAVVVSFMAIFLFVFITDNAFKADFSSQINLRGFLAAVLLLVVLGVWDDIRAIKPAFKLMTQSAVGLILFWSGLRIEVFTNPFGGEFQLNFLISLFITIFWIVGVINAINLIDGIDGLASGVICVASFFLFLISSYLNIYVAMILLAILCGSTLGFLFYNFPPAKIFLGDTGSMFLGLIIAITPLLGRQNKVVTTITLLIPMCTLAIPISDTFLAIFRRMSKKGSIFIADKKHLHHRFLHLGMTQKQVVIMFYLFTAYFSLIAFLFVFIPDAYAFLLLILLGIGLFLGIRGIGFIERKIKRHRHY